jgi:predicted nucleic acid-binding protein
MGITLDTGALIALERRDRRMTAIWQVAMEDGVRITVPAPVLAEWWRGQRGPMAKVADGVHVEPMVRETSEAIGLVLAKLARATVVDVAVVVSAASRGDVIYTSDVHDLARIRDALFPGVRILGVP